MPHLKVGPTVRESVSLNQLFEELERGVLTTMLESQG